MATRGTGKTYEQFLAEENSAGKKTYDEAAAKTKETAAQKISNQNAVIDSAAQNTTAQYQKTIDEAPKRFAGQYDDNYIDELVARKNLENSMADMGLTDSGLNRGQQTAISVMRGNADSKTRAQQQDYVTAAQQAIDKVLAQAEQDKASYENEINGNADDYLAQLWATVQQNAKANATSRFNAQEESLDAVYKAQLEAEADNIKNGYVQDKNGNWVKDNTAEMTTYAMTLIKQGMAPDDAWADARYRYGITDDGSQTTTTEHDAALAASGQAKPTLSNSETSKLIASYDKGGEAELNNTIANLMSVYDWGPEQADWVKAYIISSQSNRWLHREYKKVGKDTKDGWLYGKLDNNDKVAYIDSDGTEKTITIKELYDNLVNEGVDKNTAKDLAKKFNHYSDDNRYYVSLFG